MNANNVQQRLVRYDEMVPCKTAFIDARTPGSDKKENFCLIGGGVAENPDQVVHIDIPHGFNVGAAKQPHGCKNSHHSHDTAEVFFVHHGEWKFTWGHDGSDGELILSDGATISIPTHVFRGFENVGADDGFLYAILGLDQSATPGHVTWAPYVIENAKSHGLILLQDGRLIDTTIDSDIPQDSAVMLPLTASELDNFQRLSVADMRGCVQSELNTAQTGGLTAGQGVTESAVLGIANSNEAIGAGKLNWAHDFQVRRLQLQCSATVPKHVRSEAEVLFVHRGKLNIELEHTTLTLAQGDLFTTPIGMPRTFSNNHNEIADIVVIRGGDQPQAAQFV